MPSIWNTITFTWFSAQTFLFVALLLNVPSTISLHSLPTSQKLYIARTHLDHGAVIQASEASEIRFGNWGYCYYDSKEELIECLNADHVVVQDHIANHRGRGYAIVLNWMQVRYALIVQAVCTIISILVFFKAIHSNKNYAYYIAFVCAALTVTLALGAQIAIYAIVNGLSIHRIGPTKAGLGLYLNIISFVLLILWIPTVWYHNREERTEKRLDEEDRKRLEKTYGGHGKTYARSEQTEERLDEDRKRLEETYGGQGKAYARSEYSALTESTVVEDPDDNQHKLTSKRPRKTYEMDRGVSDAGGWAKVPVYRPPVPVMDPKYKNWKNFDPYNMKLT